MSHPQLLLHNYFRSSFTYRVRIVLHLKGLPFPNLVRLLAGAGGVSR